MKTFFKKLREGLVKAEHFVVIVCCIAIVTLVFVSVIMRYVFKSSFQGMEELIMLFAFGIYFIGGALGSREETQITADVMSIFVKKPRPTLFLHAIQSGIDAILIGICGVFATNQMLFVFGEGTRTTGLKLPTWIIYTVILIGLFLMTFYALFHCVDYIRQLIHYQKNNPSVQEGDPT